VTAGAVGGMRPRGPWLLLMDCIVARIFGGRLLGAEFAMGAGGMFCLKAGDCEGSKRGSRFTDSGFGPLARTLKARSGYVRCAIGCAFAPANGGPRAGGSFGGFQLLL
jgi:hypothetical protein